jgi:hypothetical protein
MQSITLLKQQIESKVQDESLCEIDISFIGKMYPYRTKIFDELEKRGVAVSVNPQRSFIEPDSYLSYLTALHLSTFTINLSLASGVKVKQLKCRVLETAIFGNTLITDENVFGRKFFKKNSDFVYIQQINKLSQKMLEGKRLPYDKKNRENAYEHAKFNFID